MVVLGLQHNPLPIQKPIQNLDLRQLELIPGNLLTDQIQSLVQNPLHLGLGGASIDLTAAVWLSTLLTDEA